MAIYYVDDTEDVLLSSDNTLDLVHSKADSELNRFVQKLNLKIIMIDFDEIVFIAFSIYNYTQG